MPRVYIETPQDRGLSPGVQKRLYSQLPCQKVISSHSPFLSAPQALVEHLISL